MAEADNRLSALKDVGLHLFDNKFDLRIQTRHFAQEMLSANCRLAKRKLIRTHIAFLLFHRNYAYEVTKAKKEVHLLKATGANNAATVDDDCLMDASRSRVAEVMFRSQMDLSHRTSTHLHSIEGLHANMLHA